MIQELDIHLPLAAALREEARRKAVAQTLQISPRRVLGMRLVKESIDARRRPVCKQLRLLVGIDEPLPPYEPPQRHYAPVAAHAPRVVIVGSGPGGLFAALRCLELGLKPVILERGKDVSARRFDLQPINCRGYVVEDSNYCFGEGGAGTFSDGKLFTRATKRGPVMEVYETFVAHGAAPEILTDAHPHIGSNRLPNIIKAMRASILEAGGEVHFQSRVAGLLKSADGRRVRGVGGGVFGVGALRGHARAGRRVARNRVSRSAARVRRLPHRASFRSPRESGHEPRALRGDRPPRERVLGGLRVRHWRFRGRRAGDARRAAGLDAMPSSWRTGAAFARQIPGARSGAGKG